MTYFMKTKYVVVLIGLVIFLCGPCLAGEKEKININTATIEQLVTLERVGEEYARRIIEYRQNVSPFETPEDIMKVKGIGQKTWEANKDRIVVK